jgi:hypothetical protein
VTILPIKLTGDDTVIPLSRIAVIDLEASGLGSASFPTRNRLDDPPRRRDDQHVRDLPDPPGREMDGLLEYWSPVSERMTGISRAILPETGCRPGRLAARLDTIGLKQCKSLTCPHL